ncbi:MAG: hypothetical protein M3Y72_11115 [Acidobacteriota bacterium]|nr:hypothetical protein [Acidobacteriota bacterium]
MKTGVLAILLCSFGPLLPGAAMVTCTDGHGDTNTASNGICIVGKSPDVLGYAAATGSDIFNGQFQAGASTDVLLQPTVGRSDLSIYPLNATATWDDFFALPASNPNDILKINVTGGGLGHPALIEIGKISYTTPDFCDIHFIGRGLCSPMAIQPASEVPSVHLFGMDSFSFVGPGEPFSPNVLLIERVTVDRFLPDGVTPDPFTTTPEPAPLRLLGTGVGFLFLFARKVASQKAANREKNHHVR